MSNKAVFVGNGLNLLSGKASSWRQVLSDLCQVAGRPEVMNHWKLKPFTLLYEELALGVKRSDRKNGDPLKKRVSELLINYIPNEFHELIMRSSVAHVLTTNYDYSLELVGGTNGSRANLRRETKYSVFRSREAEDKRVWHIHGEAKSPNSITLGHEQYSGQLQKIRQYATSNQRSGGQMKSPFKLGRIDFDGDTGELPYSWIDVFLRDDVHFVGYSLDYTEIDVWWLLVYKQKLRNSGFHTVGRTIFHDSITGKLSDERKAKYAILRSIGVDVRQHRYQGEDRSGAYRKALATCCM